MWGIARRCEDDPMPSSDAEVMNANACNYSSSWHGT